MSFLYLEARKGILRRYTLIALALFLCLNTVKIIADYHAGEIRPVAANTSGMQAGYDTIYERIKGPITEETVRFLTSEYQRLDALTADGTYSREGLTAAISLATTICSTVTSIPTWSTVSNIPLIWRRFWPRRKKI